MRNPRASQPSGFHAAVSLLLLAVFFAPWAHASEGESGGRAVVAGGISRGTALGGPWAPSTAYSVSLLGLGQAGQGLGARLTVLPPASSSGAWELSTDAVARFTGEGPLYFKALGGAAFIPRSGEPARLRAGGEFGVHAIRGSIGLELGLGGVYAFAPSQFTHGQAHVSLGMGLLWGFSASAHPPALAPPQRIWAQQSAFSPPGASQPQGAASAFADAASRGEHIPTASEGAPPPASERDVIQQILLLRKPAVVMSWWNSGPGGQDMQKWTHPLSQWELKYHEAMSAETMPEPIRMWPLVTPERLTPQQTEAMQRLLGRAADVEGYCHWENRRRIIKHYFMTHPDTLRMLLGTYGLARDSNPLHFALERGWQMASGQEMFTGQEVSQFGAAGEFFTALAVGVGTGKLMTATRPVPGWGVPEPVPPVSLGKVEAPPGSPRAVAPAPEPTPAPAPPASARAVAHASESAPAPPGPLAPSPELVQALTGRSPTPQVPAGPRLRQDITVKPEVPRLLATDRPISPSPRQNAQLQRDIEYLENELGAKNLRVNQQQLTLNNGQRVGINRPDLQFDYQGRRYSVEYDSPASGRGPGHQTRLTANDPEGEVILIIIPERGGVQE